MKIALYKKLLSITELRVKNHDPSHDFQHAVRVLKNAENIAKYEGGDLDILIPAALFHDVIIYPKNHPKSDSAPFKSATLAKNILLKEKTYPKNKVESVCLAIRECSFNKTSKPSSLEVKIIRDADKLEATGIISVMRTFASTGQMNRPFYDAVDPFCKKRKPDSKKYGLDLFFTRLLVAKDRMYTKTAKKIAKKRTKFLYTFIKELRLELKK